MSQSEIDRSLRSRDLLSHYSPCLRSLFKDPIDIVRASLPKPGCEFAVTQLAAARGIREETAALLLNVEDRL